MQYLIEIKQILAQARQKSYQAINTVMVEACWNIGKTIVLEKQSGKERADYGKAIIKTIAKELTTEFGKGFSERNVLYFRKFYLTFPEYNISQTLSAKLSWSYLQLIMNVSNKEAQEYYLQEAAHNMWSVRTLHINY